MDIKKDIRDLSLEEITDFFISKNEKMYRARQVYEWIWKKSARSFSEMTNISTGLRDILSDQFSFHIAEPEHILKSRDKTLKILFRFCDGIQAEGVLIPSRPRATACISTQSGCSLQCRYCATGKIGWLRNLTAGEIFDQVILLQQKANEEYQLSLTNIVLMGMGEPLLNYPNVMAAIQKIISPDGLGMSPQRITLSTVGICKMIKQLGDDHVRFNLAVSLHSADDNKRNAIMPVNQSNPLPLLAEALRYFYMKTTTRITFEYILLRDFNDRLTDAKQLALFCKNVPCKINLIEYNPVGDKLFQKSTPEKMQQFAAFLESKNLIVNIRKNRGQDIFAACGQLMNKKDG